VPACEVLRSTARVQAMILNPAETIALPSAIAEGEYYGMQSFDQALYHHVKAGRVSLDTAMTAASHPHDLKLLLAAEGERSTSVQWVMDEAGQPR
jgi:twitching motility protein PilT